MIRIVRESIRTLLATYFNILTLTLWRKTDCHDSIDQLFYMYRRDHKSIYLLNLQVSIVIVMITSALNRHDVIAVYNFRSIPYFTNNNSNRASLITVFVKFQTILL